MSLTRKVAYNTAVQVIGKITTTIISLFLVAALTRYLGVTGYGQYTTIFAYTGFFAVLADFGFFWIFIREIAKPDADINKAGSNILTLRTILGIFIFGLAFLISYFIPQYADFRQGIGIISLASLFVALNSTYVGIFQNKLRMDRAVITDVIGRVITLGLVLILIRKDLPLNSILWAYTAGNLANFASSAILGRVYLRFQASFDFKYWKKIFWQALPMGIVLILHLVYFRIDTLMLSLLKSSADVGIYGPPYKILDILLLFPGIFMGNVFPIVSRYLYTGDARLQSAIQKSFNFLVISALPIVVGVIFIAPRIIRIVAGPEFVQAHTLGPVWGLPATSATVLQILIVAIGLSYISHIFTYLVIALGKQSRLIIPNLILVVFNIGLNLILIPKISYIGAALVTVLTEVLVLFFSFWVARQNIKLRISLKIIVQVLISSLILGIFLFFVGKFMTLYFLVPLAALLYLAVLWILGGVNKEMVLSIVKRKKDENSH